MNRLINQSQKRESRQSWLQLVEATASEEGLFGPSTNQFIDPPSQSSKQAINSSMIHQSKGWSRRSINQSINQPINQPINQSINQSTNQLIHQSIELSGKSVNQVH
jgi:hypothetical protein